MSRRELVGVGLAGGAALLGASAQERRPAPSPADTPRVLVGYTEFRADLPGGMHPYMTSQRACRVRADGKERRPLAESLVREPHTWTQFAGWTPDGRKAILYRGWESPENAVWEEKRQTFRMTEGWLLDTGFYDLKTGVFTNLTAVERISPYNTSVSFRPDGKLDFSALVDGKMQPFIMDRDGRNKRRLTPGSKGFIYFLTVSPDGKRGVYHEDYQLYVCEADGANARRVETGQPFNFIPKWSPDGEWILFHSGEHYKMNVYLLRKDGTGLRRIADRQGYRGVVEAIDTPAFHSAHSDLSAWSPDGKWVYYTAQFGDRTEIMRVSLAGQVERLTHSQPGVLNYHPTPSPDGKWLILGSNRTGVRHLYGMRADGRDLYPITNVAPGGGAMHPHWRPR